MNMIFIQLIKNSDPVVKIEFFYPQTIPFILLSGQNIITYEARGAA